MTTTKNPGIFFIIKAKRTLGRKWTQYGLEAGELDFNSKRTRYTSDDFSFYYLQ